jgi:hypothetical protein
VAALPTKSATAQAIDRQDSSTVNIFMVPLFVDFIWQDIDFGS